MYLLTTYQILNMYDVVIDNVYLFNEEKNAREWVTIRGYKLVDDPQYDHHCTIEEVYPLD